ncbi:MAG: SDR family oxidoreductase [Planctomycetales bacterium]|nr:SDR family oxidoreductase [Planctomycetales bacterium]
MDLGLKGKVALVTGGAKGIGQAICESLARESAIVSIVDRDVDAGALLASKLANQGVQAIFVETDLCVADSCKAAVDFTIEQFGRIDVVVNNAGVNDGVGLDADLDDFSKSLQKNLDHYFLMVKFARPQLVKNAGAIVNIGSKVSVTGQGGTSGYAAAKGAVNALTREWAVDLAPHGVRVNAVLPAEAWTPMYDAWLKSLENPSESKAFIEKRIPLGHRFTTCEELADMVVFLASPRSSHTTGQIIHVDGGYTHFDRRVSCE